MPAYNSRFRRTLSASLPVGSLVADATRPRRLEIFRLVFGSDANSADNAQLWEVQRCTAAGTSTAVTPVALDPSSPATEQDAGENHTVDATRTANAYLLSVAMNQKATYTFQAYGDGALVTPATAGNGVAIMTPVAQGLVAATASLHHRE